MKEKSVITKTFRKERDEYLKYANYAGALLSISYILGESKINYDEKNGICDFVLASEMNGSEEQLVSEELTFFQMMIGKIFGKHKVRLTKTIENDGSADGKLTECTIEDGYVTEYGIIGRTNKVFIDPGLADIAYYVVTAHNNKVKKNNVEVKQYCKIRS